jgi:hypothetical protein
MDPRVNSSSPSTVVILEASNMQILSQFGSGRTIFLLNKYSYLGCCIRTATGRGTLSGTLVTMFGTAAILWLTH